MVSSPSGSAATKPSASASRSAAHTSSSPMPARSSAMLARTVSSKTNGTCATSATLPASEAAVSSRTSTPSSVTRPAPGSTRRTASEAIVDLPAPVGPTRATVFPAGTVNVTSPSTWAPGRCASAGSYAKCTSWKASVAGVRVAGSSVLVPYGISPVASSTRRTRSHPATLRGSSASTQPMARTGKASTVNRNATLTSSVTVIAPCRSRIAPTTSTASVPRLGSVSSIGSKTPRSRPTEISASRRSPARAAKRAVSWASRPIVLTTSAPSKLSCAMPLTSARSRCARAWRGAIRRE